LAQKAGEEASPLLVAREEVKKIHVVLLTSDRGLCGGFNTNLISAAEKFVKAKAAANEVAFSFSNFGKKGRDWARKNKMEIVNAHLGIVGGRFGFSIASLSGRTLIDGFLDGEYDEVHLVFSEFQSLSRQIPTVKQLLPIPPIETSEQDVEEGEKAYLPEHICEPSAAELLGEMLPRNIYVQLYNALLETSTSEHAARMTAMDNATKACNDMIDSLTLAYNKARQAAITADLMDIVGGAEALKG
jgi:F-type H+-transporting ATPase subunit gamma